MCKKGRRNILQFTYDIEECIDIIQEETSEISFEEFINDRKTIGYIERQLEKIGEAISQIQKLDKNGFKNSVNIFVKDIFTFNL
mgnify:CR=1 FL=1